MFYTVLINSRRELGIIHGEEVADLNYTFYLLRSKEVAP